MKRTQSSPSRRLAAAALFALAASGAAFADDSSMNLLTGDSYAYFHDLDYNAGRFNTARATGDKDMQRLASPAKPAAVTPNRPEKPVMLASVAPRRVIPSPFRDNTGN
jgi:hypothetical protein